jgi:uncharacterized protein
MAAVSVPPPPACRPDRVSKNNVTERRYRVSFAGKVPGEEKEEDMGNAVVHFEVNGKPDELASFYSGLFGWHTQRMQDADYTLIDTHAGKGINGGFGTIEAANAGVVFYVESPDIQATLDKAASLGGKITAPAKDMGIVIWAQFTDPAGNVIGLVQSDPNQQSPGVSVGDNPAVDWFEVLGPDPATLRSFYGDLFGWQIKELPAEGFQYAEAEGAGIGGGIGSSQDGLPHVNLYAAVDDLQKYLDRAEELGGKTAMPTMQVDDHTHVAQIQDVQGTTFGLYTYSQ